MMSIYFLINALVESILILVIYLMIFDYINVEFFNIYITSTIILSSAVALVLIYIKKKIKQKSLDNKIACAKYVRKNLAKSEYTKINICLRYILQ